MPLQVQTWSLSLTRHQCGNCERYHLSQLKVRFVALNCYQMSKWHWQRWSLLSTPWPPLERPCIFEKLIRSIGVRIVSVKLYTIQVWGESENYICPGCRLCNSKPIIIESITWRASIDPYICWFFNCIDWNNSRSSPQRKLTIYPYWWVTRTTYPGECSQRETKIVRRVCLGLTTDGGWPWESVDENNIWIT